MDFLEVRQSFILYIALKLKYSFHSNLENATVTGLAPQPHAASHLAILSPLSCTQRRRLAPGTRNCVITQGQFAGSIWSLCLLLLFPNSSWYRRFVFLFLVLGFSEQHRKKKNHRDHIKTQTYSCRTVIYFQVI